MTESGTSTTAPVIRWTGDRFLEVSFGGGIDEDTQRRVHEACRALRAAMLPGVIDIVPAYASVLIGFALAHLDADEARARVEQVLGQSSQAPADVSARVVEIPVCYDPRHAPDLAAAAASLNITPAQLAERHAAGTYSVAFLGFMPGFAYLQGLPPELALPRLATPRRVVRKGSVAIGGGQTGVYAVDSPGGWQIIGFTPLRLFDPSRDPPSLLLMGDRVRFRPISASDLAHFPAERAW